MLLRLCLVFGEPNPDRLLERIDSRQLSEWYAFYIVEPFGTGVEDLRWASAMAFFSAKLAGKNETPTTLKGWSLSELPQPADQDEDQMTFIMKQWTEIQNKHGHSGGIERRDKSDD